MICDIVKQILRHQWPVFPALFLIGSFTQCSISFSFLEEEISTKEMLEDLAGREADAPIFNKLGFTYGKALAFKKQFQVQRRRERFLQPRGSSPKPSMAALSSFSPEMKTLYLTK